MRHSVLGGLSLFERDPTFSHTFSDVSVLALGLLAIHLDATGHLHHRALRALSGRTSMLSAGRATAVLWRLRLGGFIEPVTEFRSGRERVYRPQPAMVAAFRQRIRIEAEALALLHPRGRALLDAFDDTDIVIRLISSGMRRLIADLHEGRDGRNPLAGVDYSAMGFMITCAVCAAAYEAGRATPEGPVELSLSALARRFGVSRVHVRRVLRMLGEAGLWHDPADAHRFVLTPEFAERVSFRIGALYQGMLIALDDVDAQAGSGVISRSCEPASRA
jgi:DNA-binding transcriptional ArsR family regulator